MQKLNSKPFIAVGSIALALISQSFFSGTHAAGLSLAYFAAFGLWTLVAVLYKKRSELAQILMLFCLSAANTNLIFVQNQILKREISNATCLVGIVEACDEPDISNKNKYTVKITAITHGDGWHTFWPQARLTLVNAYLKSNIGKKLLIKPKRLIFLSDSPGTLFSKAPLIRSRLLLSAIPKKWGAKNIWSRHFNLTQKITALKERLLTKTVSKLSALSGKFYASVFLGKKTVSPTDPDKESFCRWGLSHFLARSGLHMVIFTYIIWLLLFPLALISTIFRDLLTFLIMATYSVLSWPSISFIRASYSLGLAIFGRIVGQQCRSIHLILIVCAWVLLTSPFELFCADFQLSFSLAFALILSGRWINA